MGRKGDWKKVYLSKFSESSTLMLFALYLSLKHVLGNNLANNNDLFFQNEIIL